MEFYSSYEKELELERLYRDQLHIKQSQIDSKEKSTGIIQKFTAKALIEIPPRVFYVENGILLHVSKNLNDDSSKSSTDISGKVYKLDPDCKDDVIQFMKDFPSYTVLFYPSGLYGATVDYICPHGSTPAILLSATKTLKVHCEDKYDLSVC